MGTVEGVGGGWEGWGVLQAKGQAEGVSCLLQPCCGDGAESGEAHDQRPPLKGSPDTCRPEPGMWVVTHFPPTLREDNFKDQRSLDHPLPILDR